MLPPDCGEWRDGAFCLNARRPWFSDRALERLSQMNKGNRMERTADGVLEIRPPVGGTTSIANLQLATDVFLWNDHTRLGEAFGSRMGYRLPNGAVRSPDVSWTATARWSAWKRTPRTVFPPLCPDFVLELVPYEEERRHIEGKMREYIANAARLGWLVDPQTRTVEIYRPGREVEVLNNPATVFGEDVLPGFVQEMSNVWD